ncbi:DUF2441 domain-containing protein [Paenibacillus sp. FSL K6-1566]|uniref:DUF2441 domain-containing protein n=1 Tax=Paenibacillus sp. FSL K6-1566 TaxID=2954515 RepID=UPI0031018DF0
MFYHATRAPIQVGSVITPTFYYANLIGNRDNPDIKPQYLKEMIFEEIRKAFYNRKPSRLACNYVMRDYTSIFEYRDKMTHLHDGCIYEVEPANLEDYQIFDADMTWLDCNHLDRVGIIRCAHLYWAGVHSTFPKWETLCGGDGIRLLNEVAGPKR